MVSGKLGVSGRAFPAECIKPLFFRGAGDCGSTCGRDCVREFIHPEQSPRDMQATTAMVIPMIIYCKLFHSRSFCLVKACDVPFVIGAAVHLLTF